MQVWQVGPQDYEPLAALPLMASLVITIIVPPCGDEVCLIDRAVKAACEELGSDCCQTSGARVPHSPVPVQPPDPAIAAATPLRVCRPPDWSDS
jgi:hypothetical protein